MVRPWREILVIRQPDGKMHVVPENITIEHLAKAQHITSVKRYVPAERLEAAEAQLRVARALLGDPETTVDTAALRSALS